MNAIIKEDKVIMPLEDFIKHFKTEEEIKKEVIKENEEKEEIPIKIRLHNLGIPSNLKGFTYLQTAYSICKEDRKYLNNITTTLYPAIALTHNDTRLRVERAIRHAISKTNKNYTNSQFIALLVDGLI